MIRKNNAHYTNNRPSKNPLYSNNDCVNSQRKVLKFKNFLISIKKISNFKVYVHQYHMNPVSKIKEKIGLKYKLIAINSIDLNFELAYKNTGFVLLS